MSVIACVSLCHCVIVSALSLLLLSIGKAVLRDSDLTWKKIIYIFPYWSFSLKYSIRSYVFV